MDSREQLAHLSQIVFDLIEKYENAQMCLIESLGSSTATFVERRRLAVELERIRDRVSELTRGDIGLEAERAA